MRVLLATPPMTQLNTPYPATAYLTGCLRQHAPDVVVHQVDFALELFLRLFSRAGMESLAARAVTGARRKQEPAAAHFRAHADRIADVIEPTVRFLQGQDPGLALRIVRRDYLPEGPRFASLDAPGPAGEDEDTLAWAFGALGTTDQAKHLASLFIDDVADAVRALADPRFELARYAESLAASAATFDALEAGLTGAPTLVDELLDELAVARAQSFAPDVVGLTVPFPGNVYGALRIARAVKRARPETVVVLGGGYVNTELRGLSDPRVFDYVDYITLDDGERPLLALLAHLRHAATPASAAPPLLRTFARQDGRVVWLNDSSLHDIPLAQAGTPTYQGLPLAAYVSLFEMLNPMHRLWSDGRWNKLTVAHGCYWKKCTFCDVTLDYIARYEPAAADVLVDRIQALSEETGQRGFHFVDEAAPPAGLRALAQRLIERRVTITWWGNIRFEKTFTPELTSLLARSGCVAVSGGLEVASDRLLELMQKGVTVAQVARVTRAFTEAGVMVHAYLMYGFPTQTLQETVDALERVRQLFAEGCIQSAFWHRFAATAHSPIGVAPDRFHIRLRPTPAAVTFARNELSFDDPVDPAGAHHDLAAPALRRAVYNYMHGLGLDEDVRSWFPRGVPRTQVPPDLIQRALRETPPRKTSRTSRAG